MAEDQSSDQSQSPLEGQAVKKSLGERGIETENVAAAAVAVQEVQHHADNRPPDEYPEHHADNRPPLPTMPTTDLRGPLQSCSAELQRLGNDRDNVKIPDHHAERRLSVATAGVTCVVGPVTAAVKMIPDPEHHADGPGPADGY